MVNSAWLTRAIYHAKAADAHRYSITAASPVERNMLKRLWWCCIIRDRTISLCVRRKLQIADQDCDLSEASLLTEADLADEASCSRVHSQEAKQRLMAVTCLLARLCANMTGILSLVMPIGDIPSQDVEQVIFRLSDIEKSRLSLESWAKTAMKAFPSIIEPSIVPLSEDPPHSLLGMYTSLLWIYYKYELPPFCHTGTKLTVFLVIDRLPLH